MSLSVCDITNGRKQEKQEEKKTKVVQKFTKEFPTAYIHICKYKRVHNESIIKNPLILQTYAAKMCHAPN